VTCQACIGRAKFAKGRSELENTVFKDIFYNYTILVPLCSFRFSQRSCSSQLSVSVASCQWKKTEPFIDIPHSPIRRTADTFLLWIGNCQLMQRWAKHAPSLPVKTQLVVRC